MTILSIRYGDDNCSCRRMYPSWKLVEKKCHVTDVEFRKEPMKRMLETGPSGNRER